MGSFFDAPHLSTGKTLPSRLFLLVVVHVVLASYYLANRLMCCKSSDALYDGIAPPLATTIFFGANDAALLGRTSERQHVPVSEYKENLRNIVNHLKVISL